MKRWVPPITYLSICEALDVLYELGLVGLMVDFIWVSSSLILILLTLPAIQVAHWVEQYMITLLNIPLGHHLFLPRWLSTQAAIFTCTIAVGVLTWALSKHQHPNDL